MKCLLCIERLSEYIDGELNANEGLDIEADLQCCPECRKVMEELAQF